MSSAESRHKNMKGRLDENIIALSMLGTVSSAHYSQGSARRALSGVEKQWCCLLDELSLLCDYKTGGKSVISIAAQAMNTNEYVFWFASNGQFRAIIKGQLRWIVKELRLIAVSPDIDSERIHQRIFKKSIFFNHCRVEFYWKKLHALVQNIHSTETENQTDVKLAKFLKRLVNLRDNHEELCRLAFEFRDSDCSAQLKQHDRQSQPSCLWQAIRHYIGRLGSWWNACSILVSIAQSDPKFFLNVKIKSIHNAAKTKTTRRHCREDGSSLAKREEETLSMPSLLERHWGESAKVMFMSRQQRRQAETTVHAELLVLNHFHQFGLKFADDVQYIGCSKLSCYCCHVYMKIHPLKLLPRPCHGNTWSRWAMPVLRKDRSEKLKLQDSQMLIDMIRHTKREIDTNAFAGAKAKQLESTTGIDLDISEVESI